MLRKQDAELVDTCAANGIAFMPFFPLGTFTLYHDQYTDKDAKRPLATPLENGVLERVAQRHDATMFQIALAWLLQRSSTMACIPGTSSPAHLEQNVAAASIKLDDEDVTALDAI